MDRINISIRTGGSAFGYEGNGEDFGYETARILRNLADQFENGGQPEKLMDINGNAVGKVEYF